MQTLMILMAGPSRTARILAANHTPWDTGGLYHYESTTAIASISTKKSGCAKAEITNSVLVGGLPP